MIRKIQQESSEGVALRNLRDCRIISGHLNYLGYECTLLDCQKFWEWYSERYAAGWLFLDTTRIDSRLVDDYIIYTQGLNAQGF